MKILLIFLAAVLTSGIYGDSKATVRIINSHGTEKNPKGAVEVWHEGEWKGVCMTGWGYNEQNVVCQRLGFVKALHFSDTGTWNFNTTTKLPFLMKVKCNGNEQSLKECPQPGVWQNTECRPNDRRAGAWCLGDAPLPKSFSRIGCFRDKKSDRALGNFYANLRHLMDWNEMNGSAKDITSKCAEGAFALGYRYFGVQNWGECFGEKGERPRFDKYKESLLCTNGLGWDLQNDVYSVGQYRDMGCWKDKSFERAMQWVKNLRNGIDWFDMRKTVESCFQLLLTNKISKGSGIKYYFAVQFYGECWYGMNKDFQKYGRSGDCWNGVGMSWANNVYEVLYY